MLTQGYGITLPRLWITVSVVYLRDFNDRFNRSPTIYCDLLLINPHVYPYLSAIFFFCCAIFSAKFRADYPPPIVLISTE